MASVVATQWADTLAHSAAKAARSRCNCASFQQFAGNMANTVKGVQNLMRRFTLMRGFLLRAVRSDVCILCPISHVPVVACWSVGVRTRGRKATIRIWDRAVKPFTKQSRGPAAGGENRRPCPKQVTQLKATTERAFLASVSGPTLAD
jgi:hypothetical protein